MHPHSRAASAATTRPSRTRSRAFYGVGKDTAGAFALVSHALSFVPITLLGLAFLLAGGLSLKSLREEGRKEEDAETRAAAAKLGRQDAPTE